MWLTALIRLLTVALELWVQRESRREEINLLSDENEIQRLRSLGDSASQLLADRLRQRITRGVGVIGKVNSLSAPGAIAGEGQAGSEQGRNIHPAG